LNLKSAVVAMDAPSRTFDPRTGAFVDFYAPSWR